MIKPAAEDDLQSPPTEEELQKLLAMAMAAQNPSPLGDKLQLSKEKGPAGIQIQPIAGFSYKTKRSEEDKKVFINIVKHEKVAKPSTKKKLDEDGNEVEGLNIPMSVGSIREEADKKGVRCAVYDIIVHPDVLIDMENDETGKFREFICQLGIQSLEQKYKEKLDKRYKLPKLAYFGATIPTQMIQDREKMAKIEEVDGNNNASYSKGKGENKNDAKTKPIIPERPLQDLKVSAYWCMFPAGSSTPMQMDPLFTTPLFQFCSSCILEEPTESNLSLQSCADVSSEYIEPVIQPPLNARALCLVSTLDPAYALVSTEISCSAFVCKVKADGYRPIAWYLPCGVDEDAAFQHQIAIEGSVSRRRLCIVLPLSTAQGFQEWKSVLDPGSRPWLVAQALRDDTKPDIISSTDGKDSGLDAYSVSNNMSSVVNDDEELPEDKFHKRDAASNYIISQRDQARIDKKQKYADEKEQLSKDPNVEFIDMSSGGDESGSKSGIDGAGSVRTLPSAALEAQQAKLSVPLQSTIWTELLD